MDIFDYIIVGAGSAGCVLANRLSAEANRTVLVLEAGEKDTDPWIRIPFAWGKVIANRSNDWGYDTEPEPYLDGRVIECIRGKVLGGSWSINAMAYVRGNPGDYDRWAAVGLDNWDYQHVLPYFKRAESWERGGDTWRGDAGPVHTIAGRFEDPLLEAYRETALAMGIRWTDDYNGHQNEGLGLAQQTIRGGRRESGVTAYLRPAAKRSNLTVETGALVTKLLFETNRAVGVKYEQDGEIRGARAAREVILAGGVINSPQLLMLAGIGPADHLKVHGIKPRVDLKGVGQNLQDHISAGINFRRSKPGPVQQGLRADRAAVDVARAYLFGTGPMSCFPSRYACFVKTDASEPIPDIQILFGATTMAARPWFPLVRSAYTDEYGARAAVLHPKSRGSLELTSADPKTPMRIRQNFLAHPDDMVTLKRGVRLVHDIMSRAPLNQFSGGPISPNTELGDDSVLEAHIRRTCATVHHPLGTCRMGSDDMSVVDADLRVYGTEGLRVVDASVMPDLIGGNINAAVIMIAERASDLILGNILAG